MRKLATIRLIDEVFPVENADRLEQVAIGGWRVVVGKGEFKKVKLTEDTKEKEWYSNLMKTENFISK